MFLSQPVSIITHSNIGILSEDVFCLFQDSSPKPDMEQKLRSASSVDELMSLIYPTYWAALKCRSKLSAAASASKLSPRSQPPRLRPLTEEPTFAAAYVHLDVMKSKFGICFKILFSDFLGKKWQSYRLKQCTSVSVSNFPFKSNLFSSIFNTIGQQAKNILLSEANIALMLPKNLPQKTLSTPAARAVSVLFKAIHIIT